MNQANFLIPTTMPRKHDWLSPPVFFALFSLLEFVGIYAYVLVGSTSDLIPVQAGMKNFVRSPHLHTAFGLFALYALCWLLGYWLIRRRTLGRSMPRPRIGRRISFWLLSGLCVVLVAACILAFAGHPERAETFRSGLTRGLYGKLFFVILTATIILLQYLAVRAIAHRPLSAVRLGFFILLTLSFCAFLWQLGGRGRAMMPVLSALLVWHYHYAQFSSLRLTALAAPTLAALVLLPFTRTDGLQEITMSEALFGVERYRNFDNLYNLAIVVRAEDEGWISHSAGQTQICDLLGDLLVNAPNCVSTRELLMKEVYGFRDLDVGFPISKPGEFFASFGLWGVLLGGTLLGMASALIYRLLIERRTLLDVSVPLYVLAMTTGGVANPAGYFMQNQTLFLVQVVACITVAVVLDGGYRRRRTTARQSTALRLSA